MPRLARLDAPGIIHHVIIRGIERRIESYFHTATHPDIFLKKIIPKRKLSERGVR